MSVLPVVWLFPLVLVLHLKIETNVDQVMTRIDLIILDAHHLCRRFSMDGKRAISRGFSGGKHVLKLANRRNHGQVLLLSPKFFKRVQRWRVS